MRPGPLLPGCTHCPQALQALSPLQPRALLDMASSAPTDTSCPSSYKATPSCQRLFQLKKMKEKALTITRQDVKAMLHGSEHIWQGPPCIVLTKPANQQPGGTQQELLTLGQAEMTEMAGQDHTAQSTAIQQRYSASALSRTAAAGHTLRATGLCRLAHPRPTARTTPRILWGPVTAQIAETQLNVSWG